MRTLDTRWKIKLAAKALALGLATVAAMSVLFYSTMQRFESWPV